MSEFMSSPYRRRKDLETGTSGVDEDEVPYSVFDITSTKNASTERLKRWRQAALVLNASRRFRYTLDLRREEEKKQAIRRIRAHAEALRAAELFKKAGERATGDHKVSTTPTGDFGISQEELALLTRDNDISALKQLGGVKALADMLKTSIDKGISGDEDDILKRKNAYGSNTYPRKKGRSFWMFLWEAWQDLTLIILMVAAAFSLGLGIKTEGIKEGWYDGGSIAFAVILVIVVTGISYGLSRKQIIIQALL